MRRRGDAPLTILALGIMTLVLFGVGLIYLTDGTPILRLQPDLERELGVKGIQTRYVQGSPPHIEVEVPPELGRSEVQLANVGASALLRYRQLAQKTQVQECYVRVHGGTDVVYVTVHQAELVRQAREARGDLITPLAILGVVYPEVTVLGPTRDGVHLTVRGRADADRAAAVASASIAALDSLGWVGRVDVELRTREGVVTSRGGREAAGAGRR